jgi:hypothetical protein
MRYRLVLRFYKECLLPELVSPRYHQYGVAGMVEGQHILNNQEKRAQEQQRKRDQLAAREAERARKKREREDAKAQRQAGQHVHVLTRADVLIDQN